MTDNKSLEKFLTILRRPGTCDLPWGRRLVFEESGRARLASLSGYIAALVQVDAKDRTELERLVETRREGVSALSLATHLAEDLDRELSDLAQYGGDDEVSAEEGEDAEKLSFPRYKVVLCDDGSFGSFGICWYKRIDAETIRRKAIEIDGPAYLGKNPDGSEILHEESSRRWSAAWEKARETFRIRKDLEEYENYYPKWMKEKRVRIEEAHRSHENRERHSIYSCPECGLYSGELGPSYMFMHYGFSFNGGLILHGWEGINKGLPATEDGLSWSIHT